MFDWDQDFDDVIKTRPIPVAVPAVQPGSGRIRRALLTFGMPLAVVAALWGANHSTPGGPMVAVSAVGLMSFLSPVSMPDGLLTYDQSHFDNFRAGIARFSDAELLAYAVATQRDHAESRLADRDWAHDMLILTRQEIDRRGLVQPPAMAALSVPESPDAPPTRGAI